MKSIMFVKLITLLYNFQNFWNSHLEWKTKQLNGPDNYREHWETGPWAGLFESRLTLTQDKTLTAALLFLFKYVFHLTFGVVWGYSDSWKLKDKQYKQIT